MDNNFLTNIIDKLNANQNLLTLNQDDFSSMLTPQGTNMLAAAKNQVANRIAPTALNVRMRRSKNSIPIRQTADGKVLYSDASEVQQSEPVNETGQQVGFAQLNLPDYSPNEDNNVQAKIPQAPTDRLINTLVTEPPKIDNNTPIENIQPPKNAFEAFMAEAGRVSSELKTELNAYLKTPEQSAQNQAEDIAIQNTYEQPTTTNLAAQQKVRYGGSTLPTNAFIHGLPNPYNSRYEDLIGNTRIQTQFLDNMD